MTCKSSHVGMTERLGLQIWAPVNMTFSCGLSSSRQGNFKVVRLLTWQLRVPRTSVLWGRQKLHCCPWPRLRNQITSFPPFSTSWRITNPPKFKGEGCRPHFSVRGWQDLIEEEHVGWRRKGSYNWGHLWKILSASA